MYTINVLIMTYNQQDVISRAIESVLCQREYGLNKIIIADDCSPDNTWNVVCDYIKKFPNIIEAYRNEYNLGIYENMQKLILNRGIAEFYYKLSGDDALCDGWFKSFQEFMINKEIKCDEPIGIYGDWKFVYHDGKEKITRPVEIGKGINLFSLYIRGKADPRSLFINDNVIINYGSLVNKKGLNLTESNFDSQDSRIIREAYYLPFVGSIYYCGIGVSTQLGIGKSDYYTTQNIEKWNYFIKNYINNSVDLNYANYGIMKSRYYLEPSIYKFIKTLVYYHRGRLKGIEYHFSDYSNLIVSMVKYSIKQCVKKLLRIN